MVSHVEIRGANHLLIHPKGAVGLITRTPSKHEVDFLVRFPDEFEAKLKRDGFDVPMEFSRNTYWCATCPFGLGYLLLEHSVLFGVLASVIMIRCIRGSREGLTLIAGVACFLAIALSLFLFLDWAFDEFWSLSGIWWIP